MSRGKRKKSPFLLYLLIVLNIAASALAVYGLSGKWKIEEEGRSTYEDLQQVFTEHSEALIEGGERAEEPEEYVSQGMEEEETDQEETMRFIALHQPEFWKFSVDQPVGGRWEEGGSEAAGQPASEAINQTQGQTPNQAGAEPGSTAMNGAFPTPNPALYPESQAASEAPEGAVSAEGSTGAEGSAPLGGEPAEATPVPTPRQTPVPTTEPWMERAVHVDQARYTMDFPYFQSVYKNMVAWLYQEGTVINYPVMQAEDNEYYLDRLYNDKKNKNGAIFLDCGNSAEFIDANNYIYGHNTKTGEMFGILSKYKEQSYYDAHPQMTLLTPYSDFCIDIFASTMSLVEDETSWRLKQFKRKADFDAYIAELKSNSFFKSDVTPEWGDQFLVLCTCTNIRHGERYVVYGRMRPIRYGTEESIGLTKQEMDAKPSQSGRRIVGTLGPLQLYAQNDELWQKLRYETRDSKKSRSFGDGGNGPTAVAMAVANLVPTEELPRLLGYARATAGFTFCTHTVNQYFCNKLHAQYEMRKPEEFLRYLPLAMASFTTGNNLWDDVARDPGKGGTSMSFLPYVAGIYGLKLETSVVLGGALETLRRGGMVICLTGGRASPFTNGSQYVVLAGMDDQYLYILDPYLRANYSKTDSNRLLEIVTSNAVRVRLSDIDRIGLSAYYMLSKSN